MKTLIFLFIIIVTSSCNNKRWTLISSTGLPESQTGYNHLLFPDSVTGYLGGERTIIYYNPDNEPHFTEHAVLYKTTNRGKTWGEISLNYKNSVEKIIAFKDTLILLLQSITADSVFVIKYIEKENNWKQLYSAPHSVYLREINFPTSNEGFIISDDRNKVLLIKLNNKKCDTVLELPNNYYRHKIINNKIFSIIPKENSANSIGVLITDITKKVTKTLLFDKPYFIDEITSDGTLLYAAASDKNIGKLLKVSENNIQIVSFGKFSNYKPDNVFIYNKTICVVAYREKDVAFLGVIFSLLISRDSGETWNLKKIYDPMFIKPAALFKDNYFIIYSGNASFQLITF